MTPIAGALTITWINQYVGNHRICYRQVTAPPSAFVCINNIPCPNPAGSTNTYTIPVVVDNESCDTLQWEVYVQASCEDESSANGRVYVSPNPTFTPFPTCLPQTFTCAQVPLIGFTITNDGRENASGGGYNGTETVSVDGDTSGSLVVGIGDPSDLFITNPGSGAATDGTYNNVPLTGGSGTGATATVTITGGVVSAITSLGTALTPYSPGDSLGVDQTFAPGLLGLVGEIITVVEVDLKTVIGINFTPTTLYSSPPTVVIGPPTVGTTNATATALLGNCLDGWDAGTNCVYNALGTYPSEVALGLSFDICYQSGAYNGTETIADLYDIYGFLLSDGTECCYNCVDVEVENNSGSTIAFTYIDCVTKDIVAVNILNGASPTYQCVVDNSWSSDVDYTDVANNITITTNSPGSCTP